MAQMRAIIVKNGSGPIENLFLGETAKPKPSTREVLVKIKAFGLNRMDILQREGRYPLPPGAPDTLGVEFSGHVSELGPEVTQWRINDEVFGLASGGAYAEYIKVSQSHILPKPPQLSWVQAASIPENWLTAFQALVVIGQLKTGEDVLVHTGASGVGVSANQIARFLGARTVLTTASTKEKLDFLLNMPAGGLSVTHAINYKTQDFEQEVKKATNGKGVDVLIDFVGQSHWTKNIASLALDGRMTLLALLSGAEVDRFNIAPLLYKRLRIEGSTLRARSLEYQADLINRRFKEEILPAIYDEKLKIYIHKIYSWTEIQQAHREMEAGRNIGKIVVEVE